jgi:hypothetical protein
MPRYIFRRFLSLSLTFKLSYRTGTIGRLSDAVLLKIFRYCLHKSPRFWLRLVHVCRKWRYIVFASQQALHLRLFCAPGTPVLKTLNCWPPFSIVMAYGGPLALDPPAPEDEVNIIAALKQSARVRSISLTVTTSLLVKLKLYAIESPFLELDDLILLSRNSVPLTLPSTFLWGSRLRRLHLTRIDIPGLLQLLHSSRNLEDLQLHEALNPWYFSIEELTDALSGLAQLRSLHFTSTIDHVPPPSRTDRRVILPALTRLKFRGSIKTLERLILRIDTPRLEDIQVTVLKDWDFDFSRLGKFVDGIEIHKSYHQARILSSEHAISISLTQPGAPTCLKVRFLVRRDLQLVAINGVISGISALLLNVEDLCISATQALTEEGGYYNNYRWLEFLNSFPGVKWLHLDVYDSTDIVCALQLQDTSFRRKTPYKLYLPQPGLRHAPLSDTIVSLMISRWRSGYPIWVEYERLYPISKLHGRGASLCTVSLHYVLTFLKQDLFLSQSRLIMECSPMISF